MDDKESKLVEQYQWPYQEGQASTHLWCVPLLRAD